MPRPGYLVFWDQNLQLDSFWAVVSRSIHSQSKIVDLSSTVELDITLTRSGRGHGGGLNTHEGHVCGEASERIWDSLADKRPKS